jgi:hypothetical protein
VARGESTRCARSAAKESVMVGMRRVARTLVARIIGKSQSLAARRLYMNAGSPPWSHAWSSDDRLIASLSTRR